MSELSYRMVKAHNDKQFEAQCAELVDAGYVPSGGVSTDETGGAGFTDFTLYQAFYRPESVDPLRPSVKEEPESKPLRPCRTENSRTFRILSLLKKEAFLLHVTINDGSGEAVEAMLDCAELRCDELWNTLSFGSTKLHDDMDVVRFCIEHGTLLHQTRGQLPNLDWHGLKVARRMDNE